MKGRAVYSKFQESCCKVHLTKLKYRGYMATALANERLYATLCKVLDRLRNEAPRSDTNYHPAAENSDGLIQARSRALLHLFLKAKFGQVEFEKLEKLITDGPHDGGIDAYFIDVSSKKSTFYNLNSELQRRISLHRTCRSTIY